MTYNNFSKGYKETLIHAENKARELGFKDLQPEDIFSEILEVADGGIAEILNLYGIDKKLTLEIINKGLFNTPPMNRKGVYSGMSQRCKDIILGSVKSAAQNNKPHATLEDLLMSLLVSDSWFPSFLEYVGINPSDLETNIQDLFKIGTIDGFQKNDSLAPRSDGSLEKLFGNLAENIFSGLQSAQNRDDEETPFDGNSEDSQPK